MQQSQGFRIDLQKLRQSTYHFFQVPFGCCHVWEFEVGHTGGAIGASSVLLLLPDELPADLPSSGEQTPPDCDTKESLSCVQPHCEVRGVSVAIITNLQAVNLSSLARTIAYEFKRVCRSDYRSSWKNNVFSWSSWDVQQGKRIIKIRRLANLQFLRIAARCAFGRVEIESNGYDS